MASVEAFKWRIGKACLPVVCDPAHDKDCTTCRPPHGDACRCKVLEWRCRWRTPEGKSRSRNYDRKRDADAQKNRVENDKQLGLYVDPAGGRQLFEDFAEEWAEVQDWKDSTEGDWPTRKARLMLVLGGRQLRTIDKLVLERARTDLVKRGYSRSSVKGTMHLAKAIMRYAHESGRIGRDPTVGVAVVPKRRADDKEEVGPDDVPTRDEVLRLVESTPRRYRAATALGTVGLRLGEVMGMEEARLDLANCKVTVNQQVSVRTGRAPQLATVKNERDRIIVVPELVAVELRRHVRAGFGGEWVDSDGQSHSMLFVAAGGRLFRHQDLYRRAWYPALDGAGLGGRTFKFHALRHFCASSLLAAGVSISAVAGYLGDVEQTVLRTYAHWLRDDEDVPAEVLGRLLAAGFVGRGVIRVS